MTKTDERNKFLTDVLITAVEGGIGYWSQASGYVFGGTTDAIGVTLHVMDIDAQDFIVPVVDTYDHKDFGDVFVVRVNLDVIARGINLLLGDDFNVNALIRDIVRVANHQNDAAPDDGPGDIDAEVADVIIQAGIFGKIIFG